MPTIASRDVDCHQGGIDGFIGIAVTFCMLKEDYVLAIKEMEENCRVAD